MKPYNGYNAIITYKSDDNFMVGKVFAISDYVGFHGESIDELEQRWRKLLKNLLKVVDIICHTRDK